MARDIDKRLKSLRDRRTGTDRIGDLSLDSATQVLAKSNGVPVFSKESIVEINTMRRG